MSDTNGLADLVTAGLDDAIERSRLEKSIEQLRGRSDEESDAPYVTDPDVFGGMSREEMAGKVSALDAGQILDLANRYIAVASEFDIGWGLIKLKLVINSDWEGDAADAATAAIERVMGPVGDTTASLQTIGLKLRQAGSAAGDVKPAVQALLSDAFQLPLMLSGADAVAAKAQQETQRREAAQILEQIYKPSFIDAGTDVPSLVPPPPIAGVQGNGGWNGIGDGAGSSGTGSPGKGESPVPDEDGAATTQAAAAEGSAQGVAPGAQGSASSPTPTSAANAYGTPTGANGSGGSSSSAGGIGGFGGGSANRGGSESRPESQGGAMVPGAIPPGVAAGAAAGAAAGTGAGAVTTKPSMARPGMGMGMPMAAPGAGAGRNEDTEHETPSYLINMENGNELIGDLDPVAPPVIGA
ncbi:hypothetical protein [Rhodococcus sp. NPDC049939]|uniref:hypothetical protein n=1 Tax=Rhodococcus sp. NPDC049939 TaxID=3155511 RepID=UPI00340E63DD